MSIIVINDLNSFLFFYVNFLCNPNTVHVQRTIYIIYHTEMLCLSYILLYLRLFNPMYGEKNIHQRNTIGKYLISTIKFNQENCEISSTVQ